MDGESLLRAAALSLSERHDDGTLDAGAPEASSSSTSAAGGGTKAMFGAAAAASARLASSSDGKAVRQPESEGEFKVPSARSPSLPSATKANDSGTANRVAPLQSEGEFKVPFSPLAASAHETSGSGIVNRVPPVNTDQELKKIGAGSRTEPGNDIEEEEETRAPPRRMLRPSGMGGEVGGFTQVSWMKVAPPQSSAKFRGVRGVTISEVRQHKRVDDAWTVVRGKVYDITPYLRYHPGGTDQLMKGAGRDCTALFNKYHAWVNIDFLLEKCFIGVLVPDQ